jgi:hypothetical protein
MRRIVENINDEINIEIFQVETKYRNKVRYVFDCVINPLVHIVFTDFSCNFYQRFKPSNYEVITISPVEVCCFDSTFGLGSPCSRE